MHAPSPLSCRQKPWSTTPRTAPPQAPPSRARPCCCPACRTAMSGSSHPTSSSTRSGRVAAIARHVIEATRNFSPSTPPPLLVHVPDLVPIPALFPAHVVWPFPRSSSPSRPFLFFWWISGKCSAPQARHPSRDENAFGDAESKIRQTLRTG